MFLFYQGSFVLTFLSFTILPLRYFISFCSSLFCLSQSTEDFFDVALNSSKLIFGESLVKHVNIGFPNTSFFFIKILLFKKVICLVALKKVNTYCYHMTRAVTTTTIISILHLPLSVIAGRI